MDPTQIEDAEFEVAVLTKQLATYKRRLHKNPTSHQLRSAVDKLEQEVSLARKRLTYAEEKLHGRQQ